jgi:hypothetical protein
MDIRNLKGKNGYKKTCLKREDKPHFLLDCNLFKINNDKIRLFMAREVSNFKFMDIKPQALVARTTPLFLTMHKTKTGEKRCVL